MKSVLNGISTIIFDLGGVVLDLNPNLTAVAFSKLANKTIPEVFDIFLSSDWVSSFERGKITPDEFRERVREALSIKSEDQEIDQAWNAMLLDLPTERLNLLSGLRTSFKTLVLSNTNEIHIEAFSKTVASVTEGEKINNFFNKVYYSNELGMRKPDAEIYEFVLEANKLAPNSTLFIDDMLPNIEAAKQIGIKSLHLTDQEDLFRIFA